MLAISSGMTRMSQADAGRLEDIMSATEHENLHEDVLSALAPP